MSRSLALQADRIRHPYKQHKHSHGNVIPIPIKTDVTKAITLSNTNCEYDQVNDLGFALILLAALIALFGLIGIIYQCSLWSRYKAIAKLSFASPTTANCTPTHITHYVKYVVNS